MYSYHYHKIERRTLIGAVVVIILSAGLLLFWQPAREVDYVAMARTALAEQAPADEFPVTDERFDLVFFGTLEADGRNFFVFISSLLNGTGNRLTKRLVIFSQDFHYLGNYGLETLPERIAGDKIFFPCRVGEQVYCDETFDNSIRFTPAGPPEEVLYDGRFHTFQAVSRKL